MTLIKFGLVFCFFIPDFKTHMLYDKKIIFLNLKAYASLKAMLFTYLTFECINFAFFMFIY